MQPTRRLISNRWIEFLVFLFVAMCCNQAPCQEIPSFNLNALLKRFDANEDRQLDAKERWALRRAFGGIDVPLLPSELHDYDRVDIPEYIERSELDGLDTTPDDNPISNAGATLGRVLFYDRHLSKNNTTSCATCHEQKNGFTDPRRFSRGFNGGLTGRNSMSLANLRYSNVNGLEPGFFWDERAATLEEQVLMPIQDEVEMGMKLPDLEKKLAKLPYYSSLFHAAFESEAVTSKRIGRALAQFVRSMLSFDSKFDRSRATPSGSKKKNNPTMTEEEKLGESLFMVGVGGVNEFACQMCHVHPTFNMDMSHNIGLDRKYRDRGLGALNRESNDPFTPSNDGKFKAPSLRNIALSAPYMHDGRFMTLEQVIEHYSDGVHPHPNLTLAFAKRPANTKPTSGFGLKKREKEALVAFLKSLTDETFVNDPRFSDPFIRMK